MWHILASELLNEAELEEESKLKKEAEPRKEAEESTKTAWSFDKIAASRTLIMRPSRGLILNLLWTF